MVDSGTTHSSPGRSVQRVIVFNRSDGAIQHIHDVVTVEGAASVTDEQVEERALALVAERGIETSGLGVIHVQPDEMKPGTRYRVDVQSQQLVERRPAGS
jgi:hypothetical protein